LAAVGRCKKCGAILKAESKLCKTCIAKGFSKTVIAISVSILLIALASVAIDGLRDHFEKRRVEKKSQEIARKAEMERQDFIKDAERNYQEMISLYRNEKYNQTRYLYDQFKKYDYLEYKDVRDYEKKIAISKLEFKASYLRESEAAKKYKTYLELLKIDPENKQYTNKAFYYKNLSDEQERLERITAERKKREIARIENLYGEKPKNSAWDGTVYCIERYIESIAKDPDSLVFEKWSGPELVEKEGWIVLCQFRGKNGFGGYTRETKMFTIRHGNVMSIKDI